MESHLEKALSARVARHLSAEWANAGIHSESSQGLSMRLEKIQKFADALGLTSAIEGHSLDESVELIEKKINALSAYSRAVKNGNGLSIAELRIELASRRSAADQLASVEAILDKSQSILEKVGYKREAEGVIEITIPPGMSINQLGEALNAEAKKKQLESARSNAEYEACLRNDYKRVFDSLSSSFWSSQEDFQAGALVPGVAYRFRAPENAVGKTREQQTRAFGRLVPLPLVALADACERVRTNLQGGLFPEGVLIRDGACKAVLEATDSCLLVKERFGLGSNEVQAARNLACAAILVAEKQPGGLFAWLFPERGQGKR